MSNIHISGILSYRQVKRAVGGIGVVNDITLHIHMLIAGSEIYLRYKLASQVINNRSCYISNH